jgi:hypothetical protein
MKKLMLVLAAVGAAGLSGCAVYPAPVYDGYGNTGVAPPPYVVAPPPPVYIYGSGVYRSSPRHQGHGYGARDRDRDGIPNRYDRDRDRDGDGVPNRFDPRPNNPYRR